MVLVQHQLDSGAFKPRRRPSLGLPTDPRINTVYQYKGSMVCPLQMMHGVHCDIMLSAPICIVDNISVNSGGAVVDKQMSDVINSLLLLLLRARSVLLSDMRIDCDDHVQNDDKQRCSY